MRTSFVAGISLVLVLGCGTEETATPPGTSTPSETGGNASSSKDSSSTATTKPGGTAKGGASGKGGSSNQNAKGGTTAGETAEGGASEGGASDSDATTAQTGGKASTGGKGNTATGGKASTASTGGKSNTGGKPGVGGAGGAATGGKSSANPSTGGTSTKTTSGGNTGGTVSTTTTTGSGNTPAASFKCDNLSAAAGSTGKAKPSGAAGGIKVLDWAGFKSAISYTFDDATNSQTAAYSQMNATGGKFTFYLWTNQANASNAVYSTAVKDGHEIGNHSSAHDVSKASADAAQSFIKSKYGVTAYTYAAPNGTQVDGSVKGMFLSLRSVAGGSMSPGDVSSLTWLPSYIATTSNWVAETGKWKVICIHGFDNDGYEAKYSPSQFVSAVKSSLSADSWVTTVTNVATYQWGQNAMKAGGTKVTWSKPAIFPPNQCVRITTTGGTVKQKGAEVPWDDHGYYQISLDAGEVTVE